MYISAEDVANTEKKFGPPSLASMRFEIHPWEYDVVEGSMSGGRAHDVTMFIRSKDEHGMIAVIKKPFFPRGAYRAPSGASKPGETLEQGALRESYEETGLEVELLRYLVRINAEFTSGGREIIEWTSHIFEARERGGILRPIDTGEIEEARWASVDDIQGKIRKVLLDARWDLFRYRVALTDLMVERMEDGYAGRSAHEI